MFCPWNLLAWGKTYFHCARCQKKSSSWTRRISCGVWKDGGHQGDQKKKKKKKERLAWKLRRLLMKNIICRRVCWSIVWYSDVCKYYLKQIYIWSPKTWCIDSRPWRRLFAAQKNHISTKPWQGFTFCCRNCNQIERNNVYYVIPICINLRLRFHIIGHRTWG